MGRPKSQFSRRNCIGIRRNGYEYLTEIKREYNGEAPVSLVLY